MDKITFEKMKKESSRYDDKLGSTDLSNAEIKAEIKSFENQCYAEYEEHLKTVMTDYQCSRKIALKKLAEYGMEFDYKGHQGHGGMFCGERVTEKYINVK